MNAPAAAESPARPPQARADQTHDGEASDAKALPVEASTIALDYPVRAWPRYGYGRPAHPQLEAIIARDREVYRRHLESFRRFREPLLRIPRLPSAPTEPAWINGFINALDIVSLYAFVAAANPAHYFEIGSGNSTLLVRRAIRDHGLRTRITSFDPCPRAEIGSICDRSVARPIEDVDLVIMDELEAGDILFVDHSHRVFMNSDATVVFLDILPRLRPGILVGFHDIFLPYDYLPEWAGRYYSEQYVLAAYLLAEGRRFDIELAGFYATNDPELNAILTPLWDELQLEERRGVSFWIRMRRGGG